MPTDFDDAVRIDFPVGGVTPVRELLCRDADGGVPGLEVLETALGFLSIGSSFGS